MTVAYSNAGVPLWTNHFDGSLYGDDLPAAIAVDQAGHVFVSGTSDFDWLAICYSTSSAPLWTNRWHSQVLGENEVRGMSLDGHGHLFVTGMSEGFNSSYAFVTLCYSAMGGCFRRKYIRGRAIARTARRESPSTRRGMWL